MGDLRPPLSFSISAFGLPAVVTRPAPNDTPIPTSGFWISPLLEQAPYGQEIQRRDPRRVFVLDRTAVDDAARHTRIDAAEYDGGPTLTWRVDGHDGPADPQFLRLVVSQM